MRRRAESAFLISSSFADCHLSRARSRRRSAPRTSDLKNHINGHHSEAREESRQWRGRRRLCLDHRRRTSGVRGMRLTPLDISVVSAYAVGIFLLAQWVSRSRSGEAKNSNDYFLASKSLPWWAIGASLIAANISAEQIVG